METVVGNGVALVTGCSSGIGRAVTLRLHRAGFTVYGTGRRAEALADLRTAGIHTLRLDVTDEASMVAAVGAIAGAHGPVTVLVNNAGYELLGAAEATPLAAVRAQFETNLFGLARLTQLVLPGMRAAGYGRIVNVSSLFGRFAVPGHAFYAASKHALTAYSEALRLELAGLGIGVSLVEPTATRTRLSANAVWADAAPPAPYRAFHDRVAAWYEGTYGELPRTVAGRFAITPDDVAATVLRAATARRPRARYPVGFLTRGVFLLHRWLPAPAFAAFVRWQFPAPPA